MSVSRVGNQDRLKGLKEGRYANGRRPEGELPAVSREGLDLGDVAGLRALGTVNDLELHCLTFFE